MHGKVWFMVLDLTPALDLIGEFEGLRLKAYKDPVGIWTIGFGTTDGVTPGMTITKRKAEELMARLRARSGPKEGN